MPLVGSSGLEPPTSRLSGARSNHLSYEPIVGLEGKAEGLDALASPLSSLLSTLAIRSIALVEMKGIEPLTPCLQGRCSPS